MAKQDFTARSEYTGPEWLDGNGNPKKISRGEVVKAEPGHTLVQARVLYNPKHESQAGVQSPVGVAARKKRQEQIKADRATATEAAAG